MSRLASGHPGIDNYHCWSDGKYKTSLSVSASSTRMFRNLTPDDSGCLSAISSTLASPSSLTFHCSNFSSLIQ